MPSWTVFVVASRTLALVDGVVNAVVFQSRSPSLSDMSDIA